MRRYFVVLALGIATLNLVSCGGESEIGAVNDGGSDGAVSYGSTVVETGRVLTFADFEAAGVKHGKDYNTEGLPGAIGASLGFYNTRDIEFRFFPTHEIAIREGIPVAHEIVGPDVYIKRENVTWTWAAADQKACAARVPGGGRDCTRSPKYGDFVVYGNVIMFCQAATAEGARELCQAILDKLPKS